MCPFFAMVCLSSVLMPCMGTSPTLSLYCSDAAGQVIRPIAAIPVWVAFKLYCTCLGLQGEGKHSVHGKRAGELAGGRVIQKACSVPMG